jgi:ATP-grasp domain, R2K clade family 2
MYPHFLFCQDPAATNKVDPDFEEEFNAVNDVVLSTLIFDLDELEHDNVFVSLKNISVAPTMTDIIYRGWMLTPHSYTILYNALLDKNYKLVNTPTQYQNCHYLPDSLKFINDHTPKTIFAEYTSDHSIDDLIEKAKIFNGKPVIIKDYVKSEKHYWDTACFVADPSDTAKLKDTISNFLKLRDKYLNVGIVIREFIPLKHLAIHSKSGMPLTEEYRLFFYEQKLVGTYDYWEEGQYDIARPDTSLFEEIAKGIESNFFTMDIAKHSDGSFIIIELGDGQVSGLPDKLNRKSFYSALIR